MLAEEARIEADLSRNSPLWAEAEAVVMLASKDATTVVARDIWLVIALTRVRDASLALVVVVAKAEANLGDSEEMMLLLKLQATIGVKAGRFKVETLPSTEMHHPGVHPQNYSPLHQVETGIILKNH